MLDANKKIYVKYIMLATAKYIGKFIGISYINWKIKLKNERNKNVN
jgi:hypothetical protein